MKNKTRIIFSFLISIFFINANAQQKLEWRGINRTGHFNVEALMPRWPADGPEMILHVDSLPESYASVLFKDDVLYTTGIRDTAEMLTAISMQGKVLWETIYGTAWGKSYGSARCTPTIEGDFAYMVSGSGDMACVNITNGSLLWSFDAFEKFEGVSNSWGIGESPLIVDNQMIFTPGGEKTTVVAVDKANGETLWMSECLGDDASYVSPLLVERNGLKMIITVASQHVICLNAEDGAIRWKYDYHNVEKPFMGGDINPVTPLVIGNEVFVTSGYNHVGIMLSMADDYNSVSLKWLTQDLDVHHGGVVVVSGYIYGANYTNIRNGNWVCVDWETGKTQFEAEWNNKGQIITANGMLICYDERKGNVSLVKASPESFRVISEFKIPYGKGPHWAHPTIYDGKLFVRHGADVMVYKIED